MGVVSYLQRLISSVPSYKRVFKKDNPDVKVILCDLARIAPVDPTTKVAKPFNKNSNEVWMYIGRRQVVSYILGKINMTEEELNNLAKQEQLKQQQNDYIKG